ncbi:MAG: XRE family transcriptional regulator [Flavobacteriia bacterium]|nr:XRE family transcriptional regulator [Flavobacteriia bacterium]
MDKHEKLLFYIGRNVKAKRISKKMTQLELACLVNCEIKSIQRVEKGTMSMNIKLFMALCEVLEIAPEELLKSFDLKD